MARPGEYLTRKPRLYFRTNGGWRVNWRSHVWRVRLIDGQWVFRSPNAALAGFAWGSDNEIR
jgi:hypothetical protein